MLLAVCLLACTKQREAAQVRTQQQPSALSSLTGPRLYVSNEDSGDISVIDAERAEVVARIPVGKRPRGLKLSKDQNTLYVAVSGSPKAPPGTDESKLPPPDRRADGIAVIDLTRGRLVRTLESGADPETFDLSLDGRTVYVSNEDVAKASFVDLSSGKVQASIPVGGEPEGVTTCPDGSCVYVTSEEEASVHVIDTQSRRIQGKIATGQRPRNVVFSQDGRRAFVSNELSASLTVIDTQRLASAGTIELGVTGARPMGMALSADGATLYVSTGRGQGVALIDVASQRTVGTIADVGARPWGLALSGDGKRLYSANGPSHDVSVIDVASRKVIKRIAAGKSPWGVVWSSGPRPAQQGAWQRKRAPDLLEQMTSDDAQWVMAAKNYQNTRFSSLSDITRDNVAKLQVAWGYGTGISRGHEAAPLVVGETMYLVTPFPNRLIALDLRSVPARVRWIYDPEPSRAAQRVACCDVVNRGAAYVDGKIIYNTLDAHTVAVDAQNGKELWRTKLGEVNRGETMTMVHWWCASTSSWAIAAAGWACAAG